MKEPFYSLGLKTLKVPLRMYEDNRRRLCEKLKKALGEKASRAIVVMQGDSDVPVNATDITYLFRQESFFNWAFGVREPGYYGSIHVGSGKSSLFMPKLPESYAVWMGRIETLEDCKKKYQVDDVYYVKELSEVLAQHNPDVLLTLAGVNSDSGLSYKEVQFDGIENFRVDKEILFPEMSEWRKKTAISPSQFVYTLLPRHKVQVFATRGMSSDVISKLGRTTILAQEGTVIQELPLIFKKTNNVMILMRNKGENLPIVPSSEPNFSDEKLIADVRKCGTYSAVFRVLARTHFEKVTGHVALQVLKAIAELGANFGFRNQKLNVQNTVNQADSFVESAILKQLFDIVLLHDDSNILVESIKLVSRPSFPGDIGPYRLRLCAEALLRANDCKLSLEQIPDLSKSLSAMSSLGYLPELELAADMLWRCLSERRSEISADNLLKLYAMLPCLKSSRKMVSHILEERTIELLGELSEKQIVHILSSYAELKLGCRTICTEFAGWLKLNLHKLNQEVMKAVFGYFTQLNFSCPDLEQVLEKYLRKCPITDEAFFITYLKWCRSQRVRNELVLEKSQEYFLANSKKMSVMGLEAMLLAFGKLNYDPYGRKFWSVFEERLDKKFIQCPPDVVVEILMNCVYLGRFPLNFMPQVLSPFFLDRLHLVQGSRQEMALSTVKLLDTALTVECPAYSGPKLPPMAAYSSKLDGRVVRMSNLIKYDFGQVCHGAIGLASMFVPSGLQPLYCIDLLLHKAGIEPYGVFGYRRDNSEATAVLIHTPDHYCGNRLLIGRQAMRVRQLELMGFQVISLNYDDLFTLKYKPVLMKRFLRTNLLFKSSIGRRVSKSDENFW